MGYVIITRNPGNRKLIVISDGVSEDPMEFVTEDAASEEAHNVPACRAWGFQIVEVD